MSWISTQLLSVGVSSNALNEYSYLFLSTGTLAPELEVLRLVAVAGSPTADSAYPGFLSSPMISLPRLREFAVSRLVETFVYRRAPRCEFCLSAFVPMYYEMILLMLYSLCRRQYRNYASSTDVAARRHAVCGNIFLRSWHNKHD